MKQIIAMGGGGFTSRAQNLALERYIIEQTGKENPKVCFLPQASAESQEYLVKFYESFSKLGAIPCWISLFGRVEPAWQEKLLEQDLIYVGGGNTKSMLALWKEWKMDKLLLEAYNKGIVLSGVSAGAICWFEQCLTDSVWPLGVLDGMKILSGSCCPHYDSETERRPSYVDKVNKTEILPGIALEDHTAAHFVDGQLKAVVSEKAGRKAYHVTKQNEKIIEPVVLSSFFAMETNSVLNRSL